jgi:outer membrane protein assembly factor BamB
MTVSATSLPGDQPVWGPVTVATDRDEWVDEQVAGSHLVLISYSGGGSAYTLVVLDTATGKQQWSLKASEIWDWGTVQYLSGTVVVSYENAKKVVGLDIDTGKQRWSHPVTGKAYIAPVFGAHEVNRPADFDGSYDNADIAERTMYTEQVGSQITVYDGHTGQPIEHSANLSAGISSFASGDRIYAIIDAGGNGYEVRRIDIGKPDNGTVIDSVGNGAFVMRAALCGHNLLCVLDGVGKDTQIAAVDIDKGGEVWRRPATLARDLLTVGDRILAVSPLDEGPVSYLFDPSGKQLLSADDQKRLAVRTSNTGLLLFDGSMDDGKVRTVTLRGVDPATGSGTDLGQLPAVVPAACSWTSHAITCPQQQHNPFENTETFAAWRFAQ